MKIQTFTNGKGLIYGDDPKRISCDKAGVLKIGMVEINISPGEESIVPLLCNGCTGTYEATFTEKDGVAYELNKVTIKSGRIAPPPQSAVDFMELRCLIDALDKRCQCLDARVEVLSKIFDTNSLNFLIK